jgi:acetyl esterase
MFVSQKKIVLEPEARGWAEATAAPPYLNEMEPAAARKVLDDVQATPVDKLPVDEE